MRKIAALILAAAVSVCAVSADISVRAENTPDSYDTRTSDVFSSTQSESSYEKYIASHSDKPAASENVSVMIGNFIALGNADCSISTAVNTMGGLIWRGTGEVSWDFKIENAGLYCLEMKYYSESENNSFISFGIDIDGDYPFDEAREVKLYRYWRNRTSIRLDENYQDQILPDLVRYNCNMASLITQSSITDEPLKFYLSKGEHKITLHGISTDFCINTLRFCMENEAVSYDEIKPSEEKLNETPALFDGKTIIAEAEMPKYTNSAVLRPTSEPSDYTVSPSHPAYMRYNTIGADSWNTAGQTIYYEITVPSDGYYALNIKCRLNGRSGLSAYRRIAVNGSVPCEELNEVVIPYASDWQGVSPKTKDGEEIFVQLSAGKNIISLEAINGTSGNALRSLGAVAAELLNGIDKGGLSGRYGEYAEALLSEKELLDQDSDGKFVCPELTVLVNLLEKYEQKEPEDCSDLRKSVNFLCKWIEESEKCSVEMDYIELRTVHEDFRDISRNFFKQLWFAIQKFFNSFFVNNTAASDGTEDKSLTVSAEKSDADIINSLSGNISDGIVIRTNSSDLLEAALSGNTPDVALFVDADEAYELASRGLLLNLRTLSEYETVGASVSSGASRMYTYNGGVYGIPLTNSFPMMFCRTDILSELGLSAPESWDELEEMMPVLNENGLTVGLGQTSEFSEENAFMIMLSQSGSDLTNIDFNDDSIKSAFSRYVGFYTEYGCLREYDALRMFDAGTMPIVIADYAEFYGELSEVSRLSGLWGIYHVPGTRRTDQNGTSTLDYSTGARSLGAVIFADCEDPAAAWEFVKQFMSEEVQICFGVMKEASESKIYASSVSSSVSAIRQSPIFSRKILAQASRINTSANSFAEDMLKNAVKSAFSEALSEKTSAKEAIAKYGNAAKAEILKTYH